MSRTPPRASICLWYNNNAGEAVDFYVKTFPDTRRRNVQYAPADYPGGSKGDELVVEFTLLGIDCMGLNGGPAFPHTEAFSFVIDTRDQRETDFYWDAIIGNGGQESQCGWCKDKWGVNWQINPVQLTQALADPDPAAARRAFEAMMKMKKIDIATIEAARKGP